MAINPLTGIEDPSTTTPATMASSLLDPQTLGVGGSLASGALTADAIGKANTQLQEGLTKAEGTIGDYAKPYTTTGAAANTQLQTGLQAGGQFNKPFTMADAQNSDAMTFAQTQGADTIQNSAAAKGGLLGTNTLAGLTKFGQENAAQYQNQAFNQNLQQNAQAMGGLENLSGTGATVATAAGGNIAGLEAQGAQAGMNATLGAANQYNQAVQNAIAAYKSLAPAATTTAAPSKTAAPSAVSGTTTLAPNTTAPAGSIVDPVTGQPTVNTPTDVATGNVKPSQTIDPQLAAQINAQNGPSATTAANSAETTSLANRNPAPVGGAVPSPVTQGSTQTTPATPEVANTAVSSGQPISQDLTNRNAQLAAQFNVNPTNSTGYAIGDTSPLTGALVIPDSFTGLPVDSLTSLPVMPVSTFDDWFNNYMTPTDTGNMGASTTDPLAEFLSTPADQLWGGGANMNFDSLINSATGTDFTSQFPPATFDMPTTTLDTPTTTLDTLPTFTMDEAPVPVDYPAP